MYRIYEIRKGGAAMELPAAFEKRMQDMLGAEYTAFRASYNEPHKRGIRLNTVKCTKEQLERALPFTLVQTPFSPLSFYAPTDTKMATLPLYHAGAFYSQEPSASSAVTLLAPEPGDKVLDLCAAPGGKSTQIAALTGDTGLLWSNEVVRNRAAILSSNLERMGVRNTVVSSVYPEMLAEKLGGYFDKVLVDAPCSGEGMFRRQPEARGEWDADSPHRCADRQMEILEQAAKMLRPGGTMVYSTCTFNYIENEGVLKRFLALHPEFTLQPFALPGLPEAKDGYLHLYPHEMRGEGHFVSRLNKSADTSETESPVQAAPKKKTSARPAASAKGKAPAPIALPDVFSDAFTPNRLYAAGDALWMLPEQISIERLHGLRVLRTGLLLAHAEGRRSEPDHALAMALRPKEAARTADLTIEQALAYQAGETLALGDLPGGYTLICCEGVSLGWGKQAGGMMKNHYPKRLRRRN